MPLGEEVRTHATISDGKRQRRPMLRKISGLKLQIIIEWEVMMKRSSFEDLKPNDQLTLTNMLSVNIG